MEFKDKDTNIIFKNEPKLSEHEVDNKFNERRINLIPHVNDLISSHDLFKDKEVSVTFAQKGISSLVCIIESSNEKVIRKIYDRDDEIIFFKIRILPMAEPAVYTIPVTISLGVSVLASGETTAESLIHRADQAMYRSKNTGKNKTSLESAL